MTYTKNNTTDCKIIIVDDNLDNLRLLSEMLNNNGYKTRRAISGTLALKSLEATEFDLILLDINMPDMNGYEICQKLKANPRFSAIPVIFISALNDVLDKVKAFKVGGSDYITKPFQVEEVIARVENQVKIIDLQKSLVKTNKQLAENNHKLQHSQKKILQNSLIDPVTNFKTKISFIGQLRHSLKSYSDSFNFFAFLIIQCDRLKSYRSILMPDSENKCLLYISENIRKFIPEHSTLGRLNETEFAVFIENINVNNIDHVIEVIKKIQYQLKLPFSIDRQEFFLNPSCGIVIGDGNYQDPEQILCDARCALLYAQNQGHGNYQIFDENIQLKTLIDSELKLNFIKALIKQTLTIEYQPVISLATEQLSGLEANIIWHSSSKIMVSFEELGIIAAETGLITQLNNWLFENICLELRRLSSLYRKSNSQFKIIINLSSAQFLQQNLVAQLEQMFQKFEIDLGSIVLGISEKSIVNNSTLAAKIITQLHQLSIKVSINNWSTYHLVFIKEQNLSIDNLKINASWFPNIEQNQQDREIYSAFITTARFFGMTVTVDDIKTVQQLNNFKKLGCEFGQGEWVSQLMQPKLLF